MELRVYYEDMIESYFSGWRIFYFIGQKKDDYGAGGRRKLNSNLF